MVPVQTWAHRSVIGKMKPLNETASRIFKYFSSYLPFPKLSYKLDIIILPNVNFEIQGGYGVIFMR